MSKDLVKQIIASDPKEAVKIIAGQDPKTAYELVFEHNDPPAVVEAMPFQDAYLLVKQIGETDALDLLEMMDSRKIQGFFDLDCWEKDRLSLERLLEWLTILMEFEDDRFLHQLKGMDKFLQLFLLKRFINVIKIEEPSENPYLGVENVFVTPDQKYAVEVFGEEHQAQFLFVVMQRLYRIDMHFFYWLLEGIYWEDPNDLEEEAYQQKVNRLESNGFPEYYIALEVFSTIDPNQFKPSEKIAPFDRDEEDEDEPEVSTAFLQRVEIADSLFRRALLQVTAGLPDVHLELISLTNMVCMASQLSFADFEAVSEVVKLVDGYLSLGLEHLVGDVPEAAAGLLTRHKLLDIYKIGRSLVVIQGRRLRSIIPKTASDRKTIRKVMFDPPHSEFIEKMLMRDPRMVFADGKPVYISDMKQLAQAKTMIDMIRQVTSLMHDRFGFDPDTVSNLRLLGANIRGADLSYQSLFCTSFANDMLGRKFAPTPLSYEEAGKLREMTMKKEGNWTLDEVHLAGFRQWLDQQGELFVATREYFEALLDRMARQLNTYTKADSEELRFITTLIVEMPY